MTCGGALETNEENKFEAQPEWARPSADSDVDPSVQEYVLSTFAEAASVGIPELSIQRHTALLLLAL
jgi:hypothetical protein